MNLNISFKDKGISRVIESFDGENFDGNGLIKDLLEQYGVETKRSKTIIFGGSFIALCLSLPIEAWAHSIFETTWLSIGTAALFFLFVVLFLISKKTILNVNYSFDCDFSNKSQQKLLEGFNAINSSNKIWQVVHSVAVEDSKYAGGASASITRERVSCGFGLPSFLNGEIQVPKIKFQEGWLYFIPDRILLVDGDNIQEYSYSDLTLSSSSCRYQESDSLPSDANVIDKTWRVINKSGGPDKRIKDNPEIPICRYDMLHIYLGEYAFEIMVSKPNVSNQFGQSLLDYKNFEQGSLLASEHNSSISEKTSNSVCFSHEELTQVSLAGCLMMSIDGGVEESELHHYIEFAKKHCGDGESLDIEAFSAFMLGEFKELHKKYDSLEEKILSIGKSLSLSGEQKQEVLTYLQDIIMADGVSTDNEQALLKVFVKIL